MISVDDIRDQLRDALVDLKAVTVDAVPAGEVFFVSDVSNVKHVAGFCVTDSRLPSGVQWEVRKGQELANITHSCACVRRSPNALIGFVDRVERMLNSQGPRDDLVQSDYYLSLFSTFPAVFAAWSLVYRLYFRLVVADTDFLELRAGLHGAAVSQLPSVGLCTLQFKFPAELEEFPTGDPALVAWVKLPESAVRSLWRYPNRYALVGVEGWPVERVEVVSTLIRDAGSTAEAFAVFKLAEQLVP